MNLIIPEIISLHVAEAASLFEMRPALLDAPQVRLKDIQRVFDDRIGAHLDALAVAGEHAWSFCQAAFEEPSAGAVFTAAVRTLEEKRPDRLDKLFALVGAIPETRTGLMSALGWVERDQLQGLGTALLRSEDPLKRAVGIAACSMHRVDPGLVSGGGWLADADASVRARALRLVGEVGCDGALSVCAVALNDGDPECRFWAAWSSAIIGNRGPALDLLTDAGLTPGPHRRAALHLALQGTSPSKAHRVLKQLAQEPSDKRWLIEGSGVSGNPVYLPWLLKQMHDTTLARLAGEAFSLVTGIDVVDARLDAKTPERVETGLDDFGEPNVDVEQHERQDVDPDEGLPWPDIAKLEVWWETNARRFDKGTRYFMGAPVTREHCIDVLKNGYQRQRILAAHYLCLLDPGTPLFNTSAPAWRQQRLLARMA